MQWKKTFGWTFAGLVLFLMIGVVCGYVFFRSSSFQQFALRKIAEQADQATGGRTEIGRLDFSLSTLTVQLYNIVVRGTEQPGDPPLLQVDEITVGLKIKSVFRREIDLSELLVRHPVVHIQVDRHGQNSIPQVRSSQSNNHTSIFDLAIGHMALTNGEIYYNDQETPVDADVYDLQTDIHFNSLATLYSGTVCYNGGRLHYAQYAPMRHSLNAKFSATPSLFSLESVIIKVASSTASVRADVTNYTNPTVTGDYDIRIHAQDFAAMSPEVKIAGDVSVAGKMQYQNESDRRVLLGLAISGQLKSDVLSAVSANGHVEVRRLKGTYQLANGTLRARGLEAESLGGLVNAEVDMQNLDNTPATQVHAVLRNVSLQAVQQAIRRQQLQRVVLVAGTVDGAADASWTGSFANLRARSDLNIRAAAKSATAGSTANISVDGAIHAMYDGPSNILTVRQTSLRIPSTTLTADGQVSKHSSLQIHAQATDLHQLVALASGFSSSRSTLPPVSGSASLNATVQGSMQKPQLWGQLSAQNLQVQGTEWKSAELSFAANPSQITVSKGALVNSKHGRASFDATIALHDWSYLSGNPIHANLQVQQMSVADLQRLANAHYPVSGDLSAHLAVNGSQLDPSGSGSVSIANARAYDEPIQTLAVKFQASSGSIVSTLNIAATAGSANSTLTYSPKTKAYKIRLDAPSIVLQKLHILQAHNIAVNGTLSATANGEGTLDDPQFNAVVEAPQLEMHQKSIRGLKAEVHVASKRANLTFDSQLAQTAVRALAQVDLTGDYQTDASIDTGTIPLDVIFANLSTSMPLGLQGQTELHATLKGPLRDKTRLEAHLTIPTLNASYQQFQIGAAGPIRADYASSVVTLQPADIRGTGVTLHFQGSVPLAGTSAPSMTAQGSVDARLFRTFSPDLQSSGIVSLDVHASGTPQDPTVQGQIRIQNVALFSADSPVGVEKLNGTLDVSGDRVQISSMSGQVGGGQLSLGGSVVYRPNLQFNIALQGTSIRIRYPEGLRAVLDSTLALSGNMQASSLNGRVLVETLSFTPDFDLATFSDQFSTQAATPSQPGFADTVKLAIGVQSKENLSATSSQVSVEGHMDLHVIGTGANPVIIGRTDLSAGELFYRSLRYQLRRGIIAFEDPTRTNPNLNVSVSTKVQQYDLTITLRGPVDRLTTSYLSDPPLPTADIINLIAFGKTTSASTASSSGQSTDSMIASGVQSAIGSRVSSGVQKLAGVSSLQIDPLIGGNNQNPSAHIALQQRVSKNFLFTFSTDVSQPGDEMVQGEYQINKRWSVSMARDQLGGVSIDGRYHTKF